MSHAAGLSPVQSSLLLLSPAVVTPLVQWRGVRALILSVPGWEPTSDSGNLALSCLGQKGYLGSEPGATWPVVTQDLDHMLTEDGGHFLRTQWGP